MVLLLSILLPIFLAYALYIFFGSTAIPSTNIDVCVSHMNRIVSSISHNNPDVNEMLGKLKFPKANLVLPNGAIIIGIRRGNRLYLFMLPCLSLDPKRFVSSDEFNSMNLSVPLPIGHRKNTVYAIIRHGKAYHNATKDELIKLWNDVLTTDQQNEYAQKAMDRFTAKGHTQEEWKALSLTEQVALSIKEMRYDAPLTEEGRNEARQASEQLRIYIDATYPGAVVNVYTSPLYRAYETASYLIKGWIDNECTFSFTPTVNANFRELIEINRAMQSANHALGTPERAIAESSKRTMDEYVLTILKNPPTKDIWATMSPTERQPFYDSVDDVLAENVPLLVKKRPSTLNGVPICHKGSGKVYAEVDLFSVLSAIVP
jgi:broad specificity phosphatase PhoE